MEPAKKELSEKDEILPKQSIESYEILGTLGIGTFSRVRLIKNKEDSSEKPLAVKIFKKHWLLKTKHVGNIRSEKALLEQLKHPGLPQLLGVLQDSKYIYFFMEYISGGELFSRIKKLEKFENDHARFYTSQIVLILEYLHRQTIVFRDLKPENVLIDKEGYLKLIDFGFAKRSPGKLYTLCGTSAYLAPEMLLCRGHHVEVDWWALGIIVFEMLVGQSPFYDPSPMTMYQKITLGRFEIPESVELEAASFIKGLLTHDVEKRLGGGDALYQAKVHEWLSSVEFDRVLAREVPAPWRPDLESDFDTSYYQSYPESGSLVPEPRILSRDPFLGF